MKRIVLLTDFSETARNACIFALEMFKNHQVNFILLNAYDIEFSGSPYVMQVKEEMAEESEKGLRKELAHLHSDYPNQRIELASRFGPLVDVLIKEVTELNPYLFVLGCRGESPLENFLLGSNAYDVIKNIHHPMMVIPLISKYQDISKMVFATDFKTLDQRLATPVLDLCREFNSELWFVNVLDDEYINRLETEERIASLFPGVRINFNFLEEDDVCKSICTFADDQEARMIILVRHNYSFFERLFHPSVTRQMVLHPQFPMLILHPKD
jgi:nucleotide-binding universal stress UspA family protein